MCSILNELKQKDYCRILNELPQIENTTTLDVEILSDEIVGRLKMSQKENGIPAYYLSWKANETLKCTIDEHDRYGDLFVTPMLSGCCIGLKKIEDGIIIYHKNLGMEQRQKYNEKANYPELVDFWLVKADKEAENTYKSLESPCFKYEQTAFFWGEYNKGWNFYCYEQCDTNNESKLRVLYEVVPTMKIIYSLKS